MKSSNKPHKSRGRATRYVHDSETSKASADNAEANAQLQLEIIYSFFVVAAPRPLSADDVYDKINAHLDLADPNDRKKRVTKSTVHARITALEDANRIVRNGKIGSAFSRSMVNTWGLPQFSPEPTADELLRRANRRSQKTLIATLRKISPEDREAVILACTKLAQSLRSPQERA